MNLEELEKLIKKYLGTLDNQPEYWGNATASEQSMRQTFTDFYKWLKAKDQKPTQYKWLKVKDQKPTQAEETKEGEWNVCPTCGYDGYNF